MKSLAKIWKSRSETDARSLRDVLAKDCGQVADRRLRIIVAQLKEYASTDLSRVVWIDTKIMLADSLTKTEGEPSYLLEAISSGRWSTASTPEALERKTAIRAARKARRAAIRRRKIGQDATSARTGVNVQVRMRFLRTT